MGDDGKLFRFATPIINDDDKTSHFITRHGD